MLADILLLKLRSELECEIKTQIDEFSKSQHLERARGGDVVKYKSLRNFLTFTNVLVESLIVLISIQQDFAIFGTFTSY